MQRQIIKIDEDLCIGCGLCTRACQEGAIALVDGKAKLIRDDYCDGLGNCLPVCPTNAISFEMREADAFDKEAVAAKKAAEREQEAKSADPAPRMSGGCPGSMAREMNRSASPRVAVNNQPAHNSAVNYVESFEESALAQWPVQIKLVPVNAPYFDNAKLLIAADCAAFSYAQFHRDFIQGRVCIIGCPKLDEGDYSEKLTEILKTNNIKSVTVVRMEVPCCGGLEHATKVALSQCGKMIPWGVTTITTDGKILDS